MPSLSITESAYGKVGADGLDIGTTVDLVAISDYISALLPQSIYYNVLDFSREDYFNQIYNSDVLNVDLTGGISVVADPGLEDTLILGTIFNTPEVGSYGVSGFDYLKFSTLSMSAFQLDMVDPFTSEEIQINRFGAAGLAEFRGEDSGTSLFIDEKADVFDFSMVSGKALSIHSEDDAPVTVIGGNANDYINAGNRSGDDSLSGGDGRDLLRGREGSDELFGDGGNDELRGEKDKDALWGGNGADLLRGDTNGPQPEFADIEPVDIDDLYANVWDELYGGLGNDHLYAGDLRDKLVGDVDDNGSYNGEVGRDRFYFVKDYYTWFNPSPANEVVAFSGLADPDSIWSTDDETTVAKAWDTIHDFASGSDLLVFSIEDQILNWATAEISINLHVNDSFVEYELYAPDNPGNDIRIKFIDANNEIDPTDILIQVDQTAGYDYQELDITLDEFGVGLTGSYEITFQEDRPKNAGFREGDASKSQGAEYDVFHNLQLERDPDSGGTLSGQDKFNLTHFGFSEEGEIADILFTDLDTIGQYDFTLTTMLDDGDNTASEFFLFDEGDPGDPDDDIDRAIRVEYLTGDAIEMMVYVDADHDGDYSVDSDLVFLIASPHDENGNVYSTSIDSDVINSALYDFDDGTGVFIFTEDQYDMWYS